MGQASSDGRNQARCYQAQPTKAKHRSGLDLTSRLKPKPCFNPIQPPSRARPLAGHGSAMIAGRPWISYHIIVKRTIAPSARSKKSKPQVDIARAGRSTFARLRQSINQSSLPMEHTTYVYMLLFGGLLLLSRLLESISEKIKLPSMLLILVMGMLLPDFLGNHQS